MSNVHIILCPTKGRPCALETPSDLLSLQRLVGGHLQAVPLRQPRGLVLWCNEDGIDRRLPGNETLPVLVVGQVFTMPGVGILGPAFLARISRSGELASVTAEDLAAMGVAP